MNPALMSIPPQPENIDFSFDEINAARDEFIHLMGEPIEVAFKKLQKLDAHVLGTAPNDFYTGVRRGFIAGLRRLVVGEVMSRDMELTAGAAFLCLFMRIWKLATSKRQFEALRRIWDFKNTPDGDQKLLEHFFEFAVGILYAQQSHTVIYQDLGQRDGKHDWLLNPDEDTSVRVEAKVARWNSGAIFSPDTRRSVQDIIKSAIPRLEQLGLEGFLIFEFAKEEPRLDQGDAAASVIEDLLELLSTMPQDGKHQVRRWTSRLQRKEPGYNEYFRKQLATGFIDARGCADAVYLEHGPIVGLRFRWDHDRPIISQMTKALSQVSGSEYKVVWVQVSGMGTKFKDMKSDFLSLLGTERFDNAFEDAVNDPANANFCALHLALDFEYLFKDGPTLGLVLPNIVFARVPVNPEQADAMRDNLRWYSINILGRNPDVDMKLALSDPKVRSQMAASIARQLKKPKGTP